MLGADTFIIVFRFLHIVPGVLWVGASFLFVGIIGPSAAKVGSSAGPLMSEAVKRRKAAKVITALGGINVVAGWILWFRNADLAGSLENWVTSGFGLGLTIGGILATIAAVVGALGVGRGVEHLVDLSDELAATGAPPTSEQQARLEHLSSSLERHGKLDLALVLLATTAMATARYW